MRHRILNFCGASLRRCATEFSGLHLHVGLPPRCPFLPPISLSPNPAPARARRPPLAAGSPNSHRVHHRVRHSTALDPPRHRRPGGPPPPPAPAPPATRPCSSRATVATGPPPRRRRRRRPRHPLSLPSTIPSLRCCSFHPLSLPSTPAHKVFGQMPNPIFLQNLYDLLLIACCKSGNSQKEVHK